MILKAYLMRKQKTFYLELQKLVQECISKGVDAVETVKKSKEWIGSQNILKRVPKFKEQHFVSIYFVELFNAKEIDPKNDRDCAYRMVANECIKNFKSIAPDAVFQDIVSH